MKKIFFNLPLIAVLILVAGMCYYNVAQAQGTLAISTGTEAGSYHRFMTQAKNACPDVPMTLEVAKNGTTDTMDRLEQNTASMGIVQADALSLYEKSRDLSNIKVVTPLFTEQLHFITRSTPLPKEKSLTEKAKFWQKDEAFVPNSVSDITGLQVGAAGGAYLTAQQFRLQSELQYSVVEEAGGADAVIAGVLNGKYPIGLLVGAQPVGNLAAIGKDLKILPMSVELMSKVGRIYPKAYPLTYRNLADSSSIQTVGVTSVLVTQNFAAKSKIGQQVVALRTCLKNVAEEMAQTPKTHPAWRNVAQGNLTVSWPLYEVTSTATATTAPTKKK